MFELHTGDCLEHLKRIPANSVDAIVTDPPYAEIKRSYGRWSEPAWHELMNGVVEECRRILKPRGSAVFIIQPNSERVGRMRPWVWDFLSKWAVEWNVVQDAYWWNTCALPNGGCAERIGLMRPSLKYLVWLGDPDCYRNQNAVLQKESPSSAKQRLKRTEDVTVRRPYGGTTNDFRMYQAAVRRGGVTPFNVLAMGNAQGQRGHPAATPMKLTDFWVRYLCPEGGTVCDPFVGSGTTGVVCVRMGRKFIGIDQMPEYVQIARDRIQEETVTNKAA